MKISLCAMLSLMWSATLVHAEDAALSKQVLSAVQQEIRSLMEQSGVPGVSVAVAKGNQLVFSEGYGLADVENHVSATADTKYRTASIAKSLTAIAVMSLVEDGKLDLDEDVRSYCPEFPKKKWVVTSRQLLGHLGGVRHYKSAAEASATEHHFTLTSALKTFADDRLWYQPGEAYFYSSFGYNLLGSVAEGASGQSFVDVLKERVFQPANMSSTVTDDQFAVIENRTRGYIRPTARTLIRLGAVGHLEAGSLYNAQLHDTSMKIPGGGLLSTPADLVRAAIALNTDRLVSPESRRQMWTSQTTSAGKSTGYGLGWRVETRRGKTNVWHSGGQAGTSTILLLVPESGTAVSIMCNLQNVSLSRVAKSIVDLVSPPAPFDGDYSAAVSRLRAAVKYEVEQKQLPAFSISLVDGHRTVWADGFGFQDERQTTPATKGTVYRVGSVSKLFTDIAVMQLVERGKLDLDVPIQQYLPAFRPRNSHGIPITLRQLMTHRSGLVRESPVGNYFDPDEPSLSATVDSLNTTTLVYRPETKTKYSNAAIAVVGAVLESQLEATHSDHVRASILRPLKMDSSGFVRSESFESRMATGWMHTYDGRRFEAPEFLLGTGPAGNMYSSVEDLSRFLTCLFDEGRYDGGRILEAETYRTMVTPIEDSNGKPQKFGIGFHVQDFDGHVKIGHGGAVYGFSTQLEALPERRLGVAAVSSLDGSNGVVRRLADYALRLMLAVQDNKPLPEYRMTGTVPADRAKEMVGTYKNVQQDQTVRVTELNGELFLRRGSYRYRLRSAADDGDILTDDVLGFGADVELESLDVLNVDQVSYERVAAEPPASAPQHWKGLIGEYGWDHNTLYILEDHGQLYALIEWFYYYPLTEIDADTYAFPDYGLYHGEGLKFSRDASGNALSVVAAEVKFDRRSVGTRDGETFRITPVKPIDELRSGALVASPPKETGNYRKSDLVDVTSLDPTIRLDIRYASENNFTGAVFYKQARAFMQRPAAEAVVRANQKLRPMGLGLLIHDAYRPWHVTKMFWDATPESLRDFVADPSRGSRHNRGCAVDLTLYDLKTGEPIQMVAGYDEFSTRSYPMYSGGTSRQRWYRHLLRRTMEQQGFAVYEFEWWHFDYQDWTKYRIGNRTFEEIDEASAQPVR